MKNRIMTLLGLLIAVSMVLAACGPAETATTEPDAPAAPTEVPAAAPDPTAVPEPTAVPRTTRRGGWLDSVTMVAISPDAVVTQLQAGEVDIYASALGRAEDFKSAQAAGLQYKQVFGGYYELTFNPYGGGDNGAVFDASTGALNPFAVPAIREAMNMLVDRDYIVQEIYGVWLRPSSSRLTAHSPTMPCWLMLPANSKPNMPSTLTRLKRPSTLKWLPSVPKWWMANGTSTANLSP